MRKSIRMLAALLAALLPACSASPGRQTSGYSSSDAGTEDSTEATRSSSAETTTDVEGFPVTESTPQRYEPPWWWPHEEPTEDMWMD